ncbi:hypothetical protein PENSPDRAFT_33716 [Peniophora sp. CONT]|nr:hypothetical protein PENSPDRAFT_33716 [Peniophora sp. CONT]
MLYVKLFDVAFAQMQSPGWSIVSEGLGHVNVRVDDSTGARAFTSYGSHILIYARVEHAQGVDPVTIKGDPDARADVVDLTMDPDSDEETMAKVETDTPAREVKLKRATVPPTGSAKPAEEPAELAPSVESGPTRARRAPARFTQNTATVISRVDYERIYREFLHDHPEVPWIAPPTQLTADLRSYLEIPVAQRNGGFTELPDSVTTFLKNGRSFSAQKAVLLNSLSKLKPDGLENRRIMPDGDRLYEELVKTHSGAQGAHITGKSTKSSLMLKYVLAPPASFCEWFVLNCPGCALKK